MPRLSVKKHDNKTVNKRTTEVAHKVTSKVASKVPNKVPNKVAKEPKENRLSIRANPRQKTVLSQAATAQHMNVSQFVLQASLSEAERVLKEETQIIVSPEEYQWLCQLLDAPPQPLPRLKKALAQKPVWDE